MERIEIVHKSGKPGWAVKTENGYEVHIVNRVIHISEEVFRDLYETKEVYELRQLIKKSDSENLYFAKVLLDIIFPRAEKSEEELDWEWRKAQAKYRREKASENRGIIEARGVYFDGEEVRFVNPVPICGELDLSLI